MKVAITCDYLIKRKHYIEAIEAVLDLYPDAEIYTFCHRKKGILGVIERRRIRSTGLSNKVKTEMDFYRNLYKLPFMAKNLFVSCQYDLIINISLGLSQGFKKCKSSKQLTYLYELGFEKFEKVGLINHLTRGLIVHYFKRSLKNADFLWVSNHRLLEGIKAIRNDVELVYPPFKVNDYRIFPEGMIKEEFIAIETNDLSAEQFVELTQYLDSIGENWKLIGPEDRFLHLKENYPRQIFGERCSGEHAAFLGAAKCLISFNQTEFPKYSLASLLTGKPVIGVSYQSDFIKVDGLYSFLSMNELKDHLTNLNTQKATIDFQEVRKNLLSFDEAHFKMTIKKFIDQNFLYK